MKSNVVITGCVLALIAIAVTLVTLTVAPEAVSVSHTESTSYSWYYKPRNDGRQPVVADNASFIDAYDVMYLGDPEDSSIYLTFDVGYENGNTEKILDILKEKDVPAAFFVTGHYIDSNPELVQRMCSEGHLVCNHTVNHADLSAMTFEEEFLSEIQGLEEKYQACTGQQMPKYIRPPEGKYSEAALSLATDLGDPTGFWSFAYEDWINDKQPDTAKAMDTILSRTHPGEIALLHSTSATNAAVLGDVIDQWRADGYSFKTLDEFYD